MTTNCDVIVLGGGLAGLSIARQLRMRRPETSVVVVEKRVHPVPEAAYKVGESVAEIGAHYLKEVIDFQDHMEREQLRKFSLRVFSTSNGNDDITLRPEMGLSRPSPLRTYQIDRGRLENALATAVDDAGIELLEDHVITDVALGADRHCVQIKHGTRTRELRPRWIVDASGRAGLLRRKLELGVEIDHDVNAAWFRVPEYVKVDEWSRDEAWQSRVPGHRRWLSTVHLVGRGYWIWLIPLPSGGHSIGIVADPRFVGFDQIRRYSSLLDWLREAEPQLASKLPADESGLQDFRKVKNYAYGTRRGLSPQRWALTGEAGLFLDPLYATGMDFIAVANTLTTRLICAALDDEPDLRRRLKSYNAYYLGQFLAWEPAFAGQYEVFGDAQATAAKVLWDNLSYFMYPVLLFNKDCMLDYEFVAEAREAFRPHFAMNVYMQRVFREWSRAGEDMRDIGFGLAADALVGELFETVAQPTSKQQVRELIPYNVRRLSSVAAEILDRLRDEGGLQLDSPPFEFERVGEPLMRWASYEQRTLPPEQTEPQPAGGWLIR